MSHNQRVFQKDIIRQDADGNQIGEATSVSVDMLIKDDAHFTIVFRQFMKTALQLEGTAIKVLLFCCDKAELNSNQIALTKTIKEECMEYTATYEGEGKDRKLIKKGLSLGSINNAITTLVKRNYLCPVGTPGSATYKIDSRISWRGSMKQRNRDLRLSIKFKTEEEANMKNLPPPTEF